MKKFELFICSLGNGLTVCNKAVMEHGDYKNIAHIANCGKITWYVEPSKIPGDALLRIEHDADAMHANFEKWLDSMPKSMQYEKLVDMVPSILLGFIPYYSYMIYIYYYSYWFSRILCTR